MKGAADTIAAIATPAGAGGVGIVRISGDRAAEILAAMVGVSLESLHDRRLEHGRVRDGTGAVVDEVLYVLMKGPRSFTGEDIAEIHGHGGATNMSRLLRETLARGARGAEPGEFSRRAFLNGKVDLTRAEAIAQIASATSERALRVAQAQLGGELGGRVRDRRAQARALLAELEAHVDFPEEGLEPAVAVRLVQRARDLAADLRAWERTFAVGRVIRDGASVALVGEVNAGKSSLLNVLVGEERALVAEEAGTTRDFVEVRTTWGGVAITLIDTAGRREGATAIEVRGIELGQSRARAADLEIVLAPPGTPLPEAAPRQVVVRSKCDLADDAEPGALRVSAQTREGLEALRAAVVERLCGSAEQDAGELVTSERQRGLISDAAGALERAGALLAEDAPLELAALETRTATEALAAILGEAVGEDMLDELFARFCIGK